MKNHQIKIEQSEILCDKMKVGIIIHDKEDGIFVNVTGVVCKRFRNPGKARRWIRRNLEALLPDVRSFLFDRRKTFPNSRFSIS